MKSYCFYLLLFLHLMDSNFVCLTYADIGEDSWMDTDAWARDVGTGPLQATNGKCSEEKILEHLEDSASLIYFKKFVSMLFNRKNFKYDSIQQVYERSIVFTIQSYQMDKLEQSQDPRDLDKILTEIISNIRTPNMYFDGQQLFQSREALTGIKAVLLNIFWDMLQLIKTSEMRFLLGVVVVIMIAWTINKRFKIGWRMLAFGGIFIYGYLHTYLECNRELEVNNMLEILNRDKGNESNTKASKFISFFRGIFYSEDNEKRMIKQSAKLSLGFCRPDHVLIMYFNDIFIKYLQALVEQCIDTLATLNNALCFPYSLLSGCIFVWLIGYILKLSFKYLFNPAAWTQFIHGKRSFHPEQTTIKSNTISQEDRLSGDNLKLLLNAVNSTSQRIAVAPTLPTRLAVSGVEDVREDIEPSLEETSQKFDKNENSTEKPLDDKLDLK